MWLMCLGTRQMWVDPCQCRRSRGWGSWAGVVSAVPMSGVCSPFVPGLANWLSLLPLKHWAQRKAHVVGCRSVSSFHAFRLYARDVWSVCPYHLPCPSQRPSSRRALVHVCRASFSSNDLRDKRHHLPLLTAALVLNVGSPHQPTGLGSEIVIGLFTLANDMQTVLGILPAPIG